MTITGTAEAQPAVVELDGAGGPSRDLVGGKGWSVDRMRSLGLPVPPAFALTTTCCADFYAGGKIVQEDVWEQVVRGMERLERETGRRFGADRRPLLVSVRSGAPVSMPGMMDTILNLGMTEATEPALANETGSSEYARDTHRRFREVYRDVVLGDRGAEIPGDVWRQLRDAIASVFLSWESSRARAYRAHHNVDTTLGTAVTVQAMVFGNIDERSGAGVLFSRNPTTGDGPPWGEWLGGGQGEDVVSGRLTPQSLTSLAVMQPEVHRQLHEAAELLERTNRDIQDVEFTVESGKLWLLQARTAKRSPRAAVRSAVAMSEEGLITENEAIHRVSGDQARMLLKPELALDSDADCLVTGEPACLGLASGTAVTDPDEAEERADAGEDVILVRPTTSPDDFHGMLSGRAVVTEHGGSTSHAAVVSREIGRPCVVGCGAGTIDLLADREITVDGTTGRVWPGRLDGSAVDEAGIADLTKLATWARPHLPLRVHRAKEFRAGDMEHVDPIDLDAAGDRWRAVLQGAVGVTGSVLETDEGMHAAVEAGVGFVVVEHVTPALLSALAYLRAEVDGG